MLGEYSVWNLLIFTFLIVGALALDLFAHKADKAVSMKDAGLWSLFWVALSLGFAAYIGMTHGNEHSML
jgi:tellurite resistance protein TerC